MIVRAISTLVFACSAAFAASQHAHPQSTPPAGTAHIKWTPGAQHSRMYVVDSGKLKFTATAGINRLALRDIEFDGGLMEAFYGFNPGDAVRVDARLKYRVTPRLAVTARWLMQEPLTSYAVTVAYKPHASNRKFPMVWP